MNIKELKEKLQKNGGLTLRSDLKEIIIQKLDVIKESEEDGRKII